MFDWQKLNAQIMLRGELRRIVKQKKDELKEKKEELANLEIALKNMERDKFLKFDRRQTERVE